MYNLDKYNSFKNSNVYLFSISKIKDKKSNLPNKKIECVDRDKDGNLKLIGYDAKKINNTFPFLEVHNLCLSLNKEEKYKKQNISFCPAICITKELLLVSIDIDIKDPNDKHYNFKKHTKKQLIEFFKRNFILVEDSLSDGAHAFISVSLTQKKELIDLDAQGKTKSSIEIFTHNKKLNIYGKFHNFNEVIKHEDRKEASEDVIQLIKIISNTHNLPEEDLIDFLVDKIFYDHETKINKEAEISLAIDNTKEFIKLYKIKSFEEIEKEEKELQKKTQKAKLQKEKIKKDREEKIKLGEYDADDLRNREAYSIDEYYERLDLTKDGRQMHNELDFVGDDTSKSEFALVSFISSHARESNLIEQIFLDTTIAGNNYKSTYKKRKKSKNYLRKTIDKALSETELYIIYSFKDNDTSNPFSPIEILQENEIYAQKYSSNSYVSTNVFNGSKSSSEGSENGESDTKYDQEEEHEDPNENIRYKNESKNNFEDIIYQDDIAYDDIKNNENLLTSQYDKEGKERDLKKDEVKGTLQFYDLSEKERKELSIAKDQKLLDKYRVDKNIPLPRSYDNKENTFILPTGEFGDLGQYSYKISPKPNLIISNRVASHIMGTIKGNKYAKGCNDISTIIGSSGIGKNILFTAQKKFFEQIIDLKTIIFFDDLMHFNEEDKDKYSILFSLNRFLSELLPSSDYTSENAILKTLSTSYTKTINVHSEEESIRLREINNSNSTVKKGLNNPILKGYIASERNESMGSITYVDEEKNYGTIERPNFNFLAEGIDSATKAQYNLELLYGGYVNRMDLIELPNNQEPTPVNEQFIDLKLPAEKVFMYLQFIIRTNKSEIKKFIDDTFTMIKKADKGDEKAKRKIEKILTIGSRQIEDVLKRKNNILEELGINQENLDIFREKLAYRIEEKCIQTDRNIINDAVDNYLKENKKTNVYFNEYDKEEFIPYDKCYLSDIPVYYTKQALAEIKNVEAFQFKTELTGGARSNLVQRFLTNFRREYIRLASSDTEESFYYPVVKLKHVIYAFNVKMKSLRSYIEIESRGEFGELSPSQKVINKLEDFMKSFFKLKLRKVKDMYKKIKDMNTFTFENSIFNLSNLHQQLKNSSEFKEGKFTSIRDFEKLITENMDHDKMVVVKMSNFSEKKNSLIEYYPFLKDIKDFNTLVKKCKLRQRNDLSFLLINKKQYCF